MIPVLMLMMLTIRYSYAVGCVVCGYAYDDTGVEDDDGNGGTGVSGVKLRSFSL